MQVITSAATELPAIAVHGGAGPRGPESAKSAQYAAGVDRALDAGRVVLAAGGDALDAVVAAVEALELNPIFNAGRGATLTADGTAELDAAVMRGDGRAGAVAVSRHARSPIRLARAVLERSAHVLLVDPPAALVRDWDVPVEDRDWFVTDDRRAQLQRVLAERESAARHGTVGAVAVDVHGKVAAATSTGGMCASASGRVGDSPIIGSGTFAQDGVVAISCTGVGEAFIESVAAYDIAARMKYAGHHLTDAIEATYAEGITPRGADGGTIAVTPRGQLVLAYSSEMMHAGYWSPNTHHLTD